MDERKQKKASLSSLIFNWNAGRMGTLTVFVGAVLTIGFFTWGANEAVAILDGLPDAKFKATLAFCFTVLSIWTFVE